MSEGEVRWVSRRPDAMAAVRSGQTMVEFALLVPVIFLLVIGFFEVGRAVLAFTMLNYATREAADYAAQTTVIDGNDLAGVPPGLVRAEAWQIVCNLGGIGSPVVYQALDTNCQGWPNVVATVVRHGTALELARVTVSIEYFSPSAFNPQAYSRGVPVAIDLRYNHQILFANFIGVPTSIPMQASSRKITQ